MQTVHMSEGQSADEWQLCTGQNCCNLHMVFFRDGKPAMHVSFLTEDLTGLVCEILEFIAQSTERRNAH